MRRSLPRRASLVAIAAAVALPSLALLASSHREAPLISNDPLADNTDLYAFRSPDDTNTVTIIANYIPFELPEGGPNYHSFGENVRYEINVDNDASKPGAEIVYRFTFTKTNEDPTTFFNIRLGKENLKTTYKCEKSIDGGTTFAIVKDGGVVPPPNIGPRSIESPVGLGATSYRQLMRSAITSTSTGETLFCGPVDDPFWVDLGAIFDLGAARDKASGNPPRDGVAGFNCHAICLKVPIQMLQKDGKSVTQATSILDGDYVIGVWATASRPRITTLRTDGGKPDVSADWVQVSRLGMPLTNEAVIPIGEKDRWNATRTTDPSELSFAPFFVNPELALYMDDSAYGAAVPGLTPLRIQRKSLGAFDFTNGSDGLYGKLPASAREGTAFADGSPYRDILLQPGNPRSVDLLPIFYTGVPNLRPYQLATGKNGDPLAAGKPFINNFLPSLGDMLRLNMAVPVTPRNSPDFNRSGIIWAAALGLVDPRFNTSADLQFIPNMDGFPNGRRLEDDVTQIELQAVAGVALAAIGLWYDDYIPGQGQSPVTPMLGNVLGFVAGPTGNDKPFDSEWPYLAEPHRGYDYTKKLTSGITRRDDDEPTTLGIATPAGFFLGQSYPNPTASAATLRFHTGAVGLTTVKVYDATGREVATLLNEGLDRGDHTVTWRPDGDVAPGTYIIELRIGGATVDTRKVSVVK